MPGSRVAPVLEYVMDKSGLSFVVLLCVLAAIVLSVVLFHNRRPETPQDGATLVPPHRQDEPQ